jgi:hypothetical protein
LIIFILRDLLQSLTDVILQSFLRDLRIPNVPFDRKIDLVVSDLLFIERRIDLRLLLCA